MTMPHPPIDLVELTRLAEAARQTQAAYLAMCARSLTPERDAQEAVDAIWDARDDAKDALAAALSPDTVLALLAGYARVVAERDALRVACAAFVEWLDSDERGPPYPEGTNREAPGNEAVWRQWWDGQHSLCAKAMGLVRAALAATGATP